jgi:LysM repeat protein
LFNYRITDYKKWAKGLKKAGYATDKKYPQKLIGIIQNYKLYEFDKVKKRDLKKYKKQQRKPIRVSVTTKTATSTPKVKSSSKAIYVVKKGDTLYSISRKVNVSVNDIKKLNGLRDNIISIGQRLKLK